MADDFDLEQDEPSGPAAPADGPMDEEKVRSVVRELINGAITYVDEELTPKRERATKFYRGEPFGNEEKGRSQVVSTDVRDTVLGVMPSLMRVFHGPERTVELVPGRAEAVQAAAQATDYLYYIYNEDNPGFMETYNWLLDGLVRVVGVMKWWWEETSRTETYQLSGLTAEQVKLLEAEEGVSYKILRQTEATPDTPPLFDCEVTREVREGRARFKTLPSEEAFWNRDARSVEEATIFGHRRVLTVGQAYEQKIAEWDMLVENAGQSTELEFNTEKLARDDTAEAVTGEDTTTADPSSRPIEVCEVWVRIDQNGDGIPELRKYWTIGEGRVVVDPEGELVNCRPFAIFCPYPEPHVLGGLSMANMTEDIQRIKSALLRSNLDSLGLAIHPRTWFVEGAVNPKDVMNTETGAVLRVKAPGMVGEFPHDYVGKESFPLLGYMDEVKEQRTGQTKASNGLDADALQSSTKAAVAATLSAAQARTELLARIFAETAFRSLFKGLYQLVRENQDRARMVRLRGEFVEVDPRPWDADMDVRVVVALGAGLTEDKMNLLAMILTEQKALLQALGPNNPLVSLAHYRNAFARMIELGGFRDVDSYIKQFTEQQAAQLEQQAAQSPPPPDPAMLVAQAEAEKAQADIRIKEMQLQLDVQKMVAENELAARRLEQEFLLKTREMELKYQMQLEESRMKAEIERATMALKARLELERNEQAGALQLHNIERTAEVTREANAMKAEVAREAAEAKARAAEQGGGRD